MGSSHLFQRRAVAENLCLVTQLCPTLCDPMDRSPPGFYVHGIFQEEYWSELLFPTQRGLPNPGIEPTFLASPALAGRFCTTVLKI